MTETMRAAVRDCWGPPVDVVRIAEVPKPEIAPDQVLVRVRAVSLNRADYYAVTAPALLLRPMLGGVRRPKSRLLGGDFAGVVEDVGSEVSGFAPGDEVFGSRTGSFAEYTAARMVAHKPANLSFEEAAATCVGALTALQALRDHGGLRPGQRVLVNGASGAVGTFAVQIARALGAGTVTAVCSTRNVAQARRLGADEVIDYSREDFTARPKGYDVVVDIAGRTRWGRLRRVLSPDGTLVMVGSERMTPLIGPLGHTARTWLRARLARRKAVVFVARFNHDDLETLRELLASGAVQPVVERVYPFEEIAEAFRVMGDEHARAKLVVAVQA